jgi:hypothetical protein
MAEIAAMSHRAVLVTLDFNSAEITLNIKTQCQYYVLFCLKIA